MGGAHGRDTRATRSIVLVRVRSILVGMALTATACGSEPAEPAGFDEYVVQLEAICASASDQLLALPSAPEQIAVAARDAGVQRFVYAASSSTYGDHPNLPKVEDKIGNPLSPYAVTKYVNELYADVFSKTYDFSYVGLRYFNVFGPKQDPNGAYAAVIPKFIKQFIDHESPVINGDGSFSRDFTYIDNVIEMNVKSMLTTNSEALNTVYNVAYGERTTLKELTELLKNLNLLFFPI